MEQRVPLYTGIHKGQRRWLAEMSIKAGRTDYSQKAEVEWLQGQLKMFADHLIEHAGLEERFVHPKLNAVVPGCHRNIEEEHIVQHEMLKDILDGLEHIKGMPPDHPALAQVGQEAYLAFHRFISIYLRHIDFEEEHVQNILWNNFTPEELGSIFLEIIRAQPPQSAMNNLTMMLTAMNIPETVGLLRMAKGAMPPEAYEGLTAQASKFIDPQRWDVIQSLMGKT
jgi:hypothetical protein